VGVIRECGQAGRGLRLLASGMPDDAVLKRLFQTELQSEEFANADAILWQIHEVENSRDSGLACARYDVYSSWQWLGALEDNEPWAAVGWPDDV
jgi:hypothetical protein